MNQSFWSIENAAPELVISGLFNAYNDPNYSSWVCGVYMCSGIYNGGYNNEKMYIGSSEYIKERVEIGHIQELNGGYHENVRFLRGWEKYGKDNFVWFELGGSHSNRLAIFEQEMFDKYKPFADRGFNTNETAGRPPSFENKTHSLRTRALMSEKRKVLHRDGVYKNTRERRRSRFKKEHSRKIYYFISPTGEDVVVDGLRSFCLSNDLHPTHMAYLGRGQRSQHKGWKMLKPCERIIPSYTFLYEPDNQIYICENLKDFSERMGLRYASLADLAKGRKKRYCGFILLSKETKAVPAY